MTHAANPALTPSQTVGPFFSDCLLRDGARCHDLTGSGTLGERIRIEGRVLDGNGDGVPDAMVEIWQANAEGRYNHEADQRAEAAIDPSFIGFGRCGTDDAGHYWFETIKPGAVPLSIADRRLQAPHLCVAVFARGLLNHLASRMYFPETDANGDDPILQLVQPERRTTLIAREESRDGRMLFRWDIVLQGTGETVFFNI